MQLSKYFTLREMTRSNTATRLGISNQPTPEHIEAMRGLAVNILDPTREKFGAFTVSSGYRSPALNRAVGGSRTSQHSQGEAADIEVAGVSNRVLARWIRDNLDFDQVILEFHNSADPNSGWVHVSYNHNGAQRKQALTTRDGRVFTNGV